MEQFRLSHDNQRTADEVSQMYRAVGSKPF
jgi:hypothetical protein